MGEMKKTTVTKNIIYLCACVLNNVKPKMAMIEKSRLKDLYDCSKFHGICAMIYMALDLAGIHTEDFALSAEEKQLLEKWRIEKEQAAYKQVMLDMEREEIFQYMEQAGIWYVPMKGIILKELYPAFGMREMTDNDIFYDKAFQETFHDFMIARGYKTKEYKTTNHDVYLKKPVYNYEMHNEMYRREQNEIWAQYYDNIKSRLVKDNNNLFGYHFSDEDFYIQLSTHACKHYERGGIGIRVLADYYVYLKKKRQLNRTYIEKELKLLGIDKLEEQFRELSMKLLSKPDNVWTRNLDESEQNLLDYIFSSGAHGTTRHYAQNRVQLFDAKHPKITKKTKIKYIFRRIFPNMEFFRKYYPWVYRHPWSLPFAYIYRILKGVFFEFDAIMNEFKMAWKEKKRNS